MFFFGKKINILGNRVRVELGLVLGLVLKVPSSDSLMNRSSAGVLSLSYTRPAAEG